MFTTLLGIANPSPSFPPDCDRIKVFTPTTSPSTFTSGPPEFPGLIGASVWMYIIGESGSVWRATAETTPMVTVLRNPPGLPKAKTISPWPSFRYVASASAGRLSASTLISARSISLDTPTIRAGMSIVRVDSAASSDPSAFAGGSTTWTRCAPFTTCAFVTMYPLGSITNPEPIARCLPMTAVVFPRSASSSGPYPVTRIWTTLGETFLISASTDSLSFRSASVERSRDCAPAAGKWTSRNNALPQRALTRRNVGRRPIVGWLLDSNMASLLQTVLNPLMRGGRLEYNGKEGKSAKVEEWKSQRVMERS